MVVPGFEYVDHVFMLKERLITMISASDMQTQSSIKRPDESKKRGSSGIVSLYSSGNDNDFPSQGKCYYEILETLHFQKRPSLCGAPLRGKLSFVTTTVLAF